MISPDSPSRADEKTPGADLYLEGFEESDTANVFSQPIPQQIPDYDFAESVVAKSLSAMTPSDREDAYNDIHAIPEDNDEDPALVDRSLGLLEEEIGKRSDAEAYLAARALNPDYVGNRDFRLLFLRTDRFDAQKAALRMVRHFQIKLDLFGRDKLGQEITQDDLNKEDMEALNDGACQLLSTRDRGGRAIVLFSASHSNAAFSLKSRVSAT